MTYNNQNPAATESVQLAQAVNDGTNVNRPFMGQINSEFQEKSIERDAKKLGIQYINLQKTPLNPDYLKILDSSVAKEAHMITFYKSGNKLRVAVVNPELAETKAVISDLENQGHEVQLFLSSQEGIDYATKIYEQTQKFIRPEIIVRADEQTIQTFEKEIAALRDLPAKIEQVTAEEGLNLLNVGAIKTKASDIHYEPYEGTVFVRFRIDGVLYKVFEIKPAIYGKIAEQIKYQSKMRLNVFTVPQDGRYVFTFNDSKIAVRTASIPTPYGESFVCRYLPSGRKALSFEELGFQGEALKMVQEASKIAQGMVLVTGPTGSGKSTTLYSLLAKMNSPQNKVVTLEDPVEYYMDGVTQSQIDENNGYTFASGLRSILRHDPDVIMLGEIRDLDTAETASQASLTGHVLLSTLHTNSAIETIPRLINMGLPPFMVAPALNTIVAQRLVRKLCGKCSTVGPIREAERKEFEELSLEVPENIPEAHGCDGCSSTGYSGRLVICEVIKIDTKIKDLILNNASTSELEKAIKESGFISITEDAHMKVAQGLTTLEEVHRVTNSLE